MSKQYKKKCSWCHNKAEYEYYKNKIEYIFTYLKLKQLQGYDLSKIEITSIKGDYLNNELQ